MRLGFDVTCRGCGADLDLVNPGRTDGVESKAVLGCEACGTEWLLTTHLEPVRDPVARPGGVRRAGGDVAALAGQAHQLHQAGSSISAACRAVGIDRHTYYDHAPGGRLRAVS